MTRFCGPPRNITRRRRLCRLEGQADAADLHPLLRRVLENRNIRSFDQLDYSLNRLHEPAQLKGIEGATARLQSAVQGGEKILVIGDYDADGATATAVALLGLRALGAGAVDYLAPNRFEYGYGLSPEIAEVALTRKPDVVITVDNGISSISGTARLRAAGVSVIITDHHLAGDELPEADAIVNPNQPGCGFPSKALAGVGVMFYLLLSLRAALRSAGRFNDRRWPEPNLAELLDLVAIGTVADLVPLDYNNRILVSQGLARVRAGRCRPGIKALLEMAGKGLDGLAASDFGFVIGPRLNAAGRMDDISTGIECLLADHPGEALRHARLLNEMNIARRRVELSMQQQALQIVAHLGARDADAGSGRFGWCLFQPEWHQGIVGLVATRIREKFHQPAVVFAPAGDARLRGSARSVAGLHIRDLLEAISTRHPGLIQKFGGHAMAAGLTIAAEQFETFAEHFSAMVEAHFKDRPPDYDLLTDGALAIGEFTLETAELMRTASPWGQHFPAPVFDGEFRVTDQRVVGEQHLKMTLVPVAGETSEVNGDQGAQDNQDAENPKGTGGFDAIVFRYLEPGQDAPPLHIVKAAYQLQVNEFRGRRSLQLLIEYLQPCRAAPAPEPEPEPIPAIP